MIIKEIKNSKEKEKISTDILSNLPEWFGIPESTKEYIEKSKNLPFIAYFINETAVAFAVLKATSNVTAEIFVMAVLKQYHHQSIGTKLYTEFESMAKAKGFEYIQVKTVKQGLYKEYDSTNNFYKSVGFKKLECFPDLWDKSNPCQIYIKYIGNYQK